MSQTNQPAGTGFTGLYIKLSDGTYTPIFNDSGVYVGDALTRASLSTPAASKSVLTDTFTKATTGASDQYVIVPEAGTLSSVDFSGIDALATSDSNYITFTITNLGQAGAGTTVMLAATAPNTTKATGGSAIVANGKFPLTLNGTASNLVVAQGDRLKVSATATGTLAGTVTGSTFCLRFAGTT